MDLLGERLRLVYSLVPNGCRFIDVGTDHGFLPVQLLLDGKVSYAASSDINEMPLNSARRTAAKYAVQMDFFLSDGFDSVKCEFDCAALCGMGGMNIIDILKRADIRQGTRLLLQPMRNDDALRAFLWTNGYKTEREAFATENGKAYVVFSSVKTGRNTAFGLSDTFIGFEDYTGNGAAAYARKVLTRLTKMRQGAHSTGADTSMLDYTINELRNRINKGDNGNGV